VRELEKVIKRALVLACGDVITPDDIEPALRASPDREPEWPALAWAEVAGMLDAGEPPVLGGPYPYLVERLERAIVLGAVRRSGGNHTRAACLLGIHRNTLRQKLKDLGLHVSERAGPERASGARA
jgi:two-component system nitrogen regulation response regulator GlnG